MFHQVKYLVDQVKKVNASMFCSWRLALILPLLFLTSSTVTHAESLPTYIPRQLESSSLASVGSDSMQPLMDAWLQSYREYQPELDLSLASRGSATAPPALMAGAADVGPMARPMKKFEREKFRERFGFEPTQIRTAIAGLALYVSDKNPLTKLSISELEAIFSENPTRSQRLATWGDLGVGGSLAQVKILPVGRVAPSYVHGYFKQKVLLQKDYRSDVLLTADFNAVVETLRANRSAIGLAEYRANPPKGVKVLAIREDHNSPAVKPTPTSIAADRYPLARYLSVYVVRSPGQPLEDSTTDFLSFVLSRQGQAVVSELGLTALTPQMIESEREKLN